MKILTLFIIVYSIVISWFKDLPDIEGDVTYHIKTFAILYSPKVVVIAGNLLVGCAYAFTIYLKWLDYDSTEIPTFKTKVLLFGHLIVLALFIINAFSIRLNEHDSIKKFYMRFWWFFFVEYALYILAFSVNI